MGDQDRLDALPTRRAFFKWIGTGALVIALGGAIRYLGRNEDFIRPPRALPEEEFLSLCIRCDKCRKACPNGLITPVLLTESVVSFGTPRLEAYCSRCRRCIDACPTLALR